MTSFENFHFLRPAWLFAIALLIPAVWSALRSHQGSGAWRRVCDPELLRHLVLDGGGRSSRTALAILAVAWTAACLALAGPTWQRLPQPAFKEPVQTVLALNLAPSMNARDIAPTRLVRARYALLDVLDRVEGAVGLVIFAEEPYPVTPLTDDPSVISSQVPLLESSLMPGRGARVDRAIDQAHELLTQAGAGHGRVLLLGDGLGDAPDAALAAAERAEAAGFPVSVLGIGGDAAGLEALAEAGGGRFATVRADDADLDYLFGRQGNPASMLATAERSGVKADTWSDAGAWLVLIPLLLAPLAFRRGWAAALCVLIFAAAEPRTATAGAADWFARPDQQGAAALERGDAVGAAELFEDPEWRGAAQYRSGDFEAVVATLQGREDGRSQYNLGNALARANQLEQAMGAYDRVLEIEPDHEDARFNRELVEKLLEQQQQEQQEQQQQQASEGSGESDESSQDEASADDASSRGAEESAQADPGEESSDTGEASSGQDSAANDSEGDGSQAQAEHPGEREVAENPTAGQGESEAGEQEPAGAEPQGAADQEPAGAEPQGAADQEPAGAEPQRAGEQETAGAESHASGVEGTEAPEQAGRPTAATGSGRELSERDQEVEQWLNRVPDDPGGLLREKLRRRYAERRYGANGGWR